MHAWTPAAESTVTMRFTRVGYGRLVREDGTLVSRHVSAEEAYERASSEPGTCFYHPPAVRIERVVRAPALGLIDGGGVLR